MSTVAPAECHNHPWWNYDLLNIQNGVNDVKVRLVSKYLLVLFLAQKITWID